MSGFDTDHDSVDFLGNQNKYSKQLLFFPSQSCKVGGCPTNTSRKSPNDNLLCSDSADQMRLVTVLVLVASHASFEASVHLSPVSGSGIPQTCLVNHSSPSTTASQPGEVSLRGRSNM